MHHVKTVLTTVVISAVTTALIFRIKALRNNVAGVA